MSMTSRQSNYPITSQMAASIETCVASVEFACRTVSIGLKCEDEDKKG